MRAGAALAPERPGQRLDRTADALLFLGAARTLVTTAPLPTRFRDRYVRAIRHRHRLLFGTRFEPARAFPTSRCSSPADGAGRVGPSSGPLA